MGTMACNCNLQLKSMGLFQSRMNDMELRFKMGSTLNETFLVFFKTLCLNRSFLHFVKLRNANHFSCSLLNSNPFTTQMATPLLTNGSENHDLKSAGLYSNSIVVLASLDFQKDSWVKLRFKDVGNVFCMKRNVGS